MSITVTRQAAGEFRILLPTVGGSTTRFVEWRLKTTVDGTWTIQGLYGRDFSTTPSTDVQLSDASDSSVYEYAWKVGVAGAGAIGFDFFGNAHGHETLLTVSLLLSGSDVSGWAVGQSDVGTNFVAYQTTNTRLPKNANGTPNDVTVCGSSTLRHTFDVSGLLVEHTHTMTAGYVGYTDYAAMCPTSLANLNRVRIGTFPLYAPVADNSVLGSGNQATTFSAWHTTAHPYWLTMTLPYLAPDSTGLWTHSGPDYTNFIDGNQYGKFYVLEVGSTLALAVNTGSTTHAQRYVVSVTTGHSHAGSAFAADAFDVEPDAVVMPCQQSTSLTLGAIQDLLAQKWESVPFWTAEEARLAFNEALRVYNLLTGLWKRRVAITTTAGQCWVPVPSTLVYNLRMDFDERPLQLSALGDLDNGRPGWEAETTASGGSVPTRPQVFAPAGLSLIAIWPADAVGGHTLVVDGVRQTPVLVQGGDLAAINMNDLQVLLGYALHVAALKLGGARFQQTVPFYQAFLAAAADLNGQLKASAIFRRAMGQDVNRGMRPMRPDPTARA